VWAAYRKGVEFPGILLDLAAAGFKATFEEMVLTNYDAAWTMFAQAKGKMQPVGLALGFWSHPKARTMVLDRLVWFPWASTRNRIESAVNFFVKVRHEIPMIGFARPEDEAFFVALLRHGMLRRVGTSLTVFEDEQAMVYETRLEN
jgi:hypothetical protein